ncbi:MAG: hypothetical protein JXN61_02760, partial [Sedimentisphaerales bacterium]|nr:hypothetical protein [Sedimentisphaerales bacterium]
MMNRRLRRAAHLLVHLTVLQFFIGGACFGADWPMWRCDAARSGASADGLAEQLHLQWVRRMPK